MLEADAGLRAHSRLAFSTLVETTTARTQGTRADRGTKRLLVGSMIVALALAVLAARHATAASMPASGWIWVVAGLSLMWAGTALRVWSIATLGRFFRRDVLVQTGHRVVTTDPYRLIRHPAYSGTSSPQRGWGWHSSTG